MPTTVCLGPEWMSCWTAAAQCSMDSFTLQEGYGCSVLYSKMAGVMTPRDLILLYRIIVVPVGIIVYSTLSIPVFSFWIDMLIIVFATAVHSFVCS